MAIKYLDILLSRLVRCIIYTRNLKTIIMKQYSKVRFFIEYVLILFGSYLLLSGIVAFIGNYNYREVLCSPEQVIFLVLVYWWIPVFRMIDMEEFNAKNK